MAEITLYNTRTRQKERFDPIDPANVRMYVCGPTVYDRAHIGNARPVVVFDVLYRLLRHVYGADHVTYVRNFTDVDDKINARGRDQGRGETDSRHPPHHRRDHRLVSARIWTRSARCGPPMSRARPSISRRWWR